MVYAEIKNKVRSFYNDNKKKNINFNDVYPCLIAFGTQTIVTKGGNMGVFIKDIKAKFPIADGKVVSEIVKSLL